MPLHVPHSSAKLSLRQCPFPLKGSCIALLPLWHGVVLLNQATQPWDTILVQRVILLPPDAGEGWDEGASAGGVRPDSSPPPWPSPVSGGGEPVCQSHGVWFSGGYSTGWRSSGRNARHSPTSACAAQVRPTPAARRSLYPHVRGRPSLDEDNLTGT